MSDLPRLAELLKAKNTVDSKIATLIGRPAHIGDVGEYIASVIFGIALEESASNKGSNGKFSRGPLAGSTVDIQWHTKHDGILNLKSDAVPDYYLVFTGPKTGVNSAHSIFNPWVIEFVFLFNASELLSALHERGVQIGRGTSVTGPLWERAEIYPVQHNSRLILSNEERQLLALFR